jgi:hypothetical protein
MISMKEYLDEVAILTDFGEPITQAAKLLVKKTLFEIDDKQSDLSATKREVFHRIVAKLLYVSRGRLGDIQLPITFLCTHILVSTEHDWWKLRRVLEFLHGTLNEELILGRADDILGNMCNVDTD